jgi:hypothetical protein
VLVELGRLVRMVYRARGVRVVEWPERGAPLLCYESTQKKAPLLIVYGGRRIGGASLGGAAEYARTHWGRVGHLQEVSGATLEGDLEVLGPCVSVSYVTRKGDSPEVFEFVHDFGTVEGPGGKPKKLPRFTPPEVCTSRSRGVPRGTFQLAGGTYRVTSHGIVG